MKEVPIHGHGKAPHDHSHKHHSEHYGKHAAGHMMEHDKVAKMCGGGYAKGKK